MGRGVGFSNTLTHPMDSMGWGEHPKTRPRGPTPQPKDRILFSKPVNKLVLFQPDGTEFDFGGAIKGWIPVVDEALLEGQQKVYVVAGLYEAKPVDAPKRKSKEEYVHGEDVCISHHILYTRT